MTAIALNKDRTSKTKMIALSSTQPIIYLIALSKIKTIAFLNMNQQNDRIAPHHHKKRSPFPKN